MNEIIGAIAGDVVGSIYEFDNIRTKEFELVGERCFFTDDTVLTVAVAEAIAEWMRGNGRIERLAETLIRGYAMKYPYLSYGNSFRRWVSFGKGPYGSYGNGAAMRVSPAGWAARSATEAKAISRAVTAVTHDHHEGIRGAECVAVCIWMIRAGYSDEEIRETVLRDYYRIGFSLSDIRGTYGFDETCQGSVPEALQCYFEAESFEDALRNAVSIGGDSDTIAAIAGSLAEARYGVPDAIREAVLAKLDPFLRGRLSDSSSAILGGCSSLERIAKSGKKEEN